MTVDKRFQQFAVGLLTALSLLASSASACTCSLHEEAAERQVLSCHHESDSPAPGVDNSNVCSASDEDCVCCSATERKIVAKSVGIKLKEQTATASLESLSSLPVVSPPAGVKIGFAKPLYLSDIILRSLAPTRFPAPVKQNIQCLSRII